MMQPMTAHRIIPVLTLLALMSVGAFAQSNSSSQPPAPAAPTADKQAGAKQGQGSQGAHSDSSYVIGANDVLAINVWKEPDISRSVPVRSDGKISLPLVGELRRAAKPRYNSSKKLPSACRTISPSPKLPSSLPIARVRR